MYEYISIYRMYDLLKKAQCSLCATILIRKKAHAANMVRKQTVKHMSSQYC